MANPSDIKHGIQVWIGVDLDGTLAHRIPGTVFGEPGKPITLMVERVKRWLAQGWKVKIVTARVYYPEEATIQVPMIQKWCSIHLGKVLDITCMKDPGMLELWDDRAISVERNTGNFSYCSDQATVSND